MKLSQCKHGVLVLNVRANWESSASGLVGMVVGITQNSTGEAIPLVQWQNYLEPKATHHCNLEIYEE